MSGVEAKILNPQLSWKDKVAHAKHTETLIKLFNDNFKQFSVDEKIREAGPTLS